METLSWAVLVSPDPALLLSALPVFCRNFQKPVARGIVGIYVYGFHARCQHEEDTEMLFLCCEEVQCQRCLPFRGELLSV